MAGRSYLKTEAQTSSLSAAISDAFDEVGELADEMGEWRDSLEEKFSQTDKYSRVSEAADTLDGHRDAPDFDESVVGDIQVTYGVTSNRSKRRGISRATRLDNAVGKLNACVEALQAEADSLDEQIEELDDSRQEERGELSERKEALEELQQELEEAVGELDGGVEFPGMYG